MLISGISLLITSAKFPAHVVWNDLFTAWHTSLLLLHHHWNFYGLVLFFPEGLSVLTPRMKFSLSEALPIRMDLMEIYVRF